MKSTLRQTLERFGSRSLYVRLTLFAALIVVLSTVVRLVVVTTLLDRDARKTAGENQFATATYIAKDVDARIRLRFDFLRLAAERFTDDSKGKASRWLEDSLSYRLLFSGGLALYDPTGTLIAETATPGQQPASVAGQDWFAKALDSQGPLIARLYRAGDRPFMTMATAVRDSSGRPLALLTGTAGLIEDNFLKSVYEQKVGEAGSVLVVDPVANLLVTSSLGPKFLAPAAPPGINPLHDKGRSGFRGVGETVNADGQQVLSAMVSIPAAGWFLVVQEPTDQAYRPVWLLKNNFVLFGGISVLVASFIVYSILAYLLGPLTEAAGRLHAMAQNDEPIDFLPLRRNDEIGMIVTCFNSLLANLREKEALVSHMAYHDALTGLPNLQLFRDRLTQGLHHAQRQRSDLALLYLDLDGFKPINDKYGHAAGDAVLQEIARRVTSLLRKSDTVARIGGDEFAVILAESGDDGVLVAEKCREVVSHPISFEGQTVSVGVSIGVARYPIDGTTEEELLRAADDAMYQAKRLAREGSGDACKSTGSPL